MYYPNTVQPTSTGMWPNTYQYSTQQQQAVPAVYYQMPSYPATTMPSYPTTTMPSYPTTTMPEVFTQQQSIPAIYYQMPTVTVPPIATTTTTAEVVAPQPTSTTTTTKSVTTKVVDPSTLPTIGNRSVVEETKTTTTLGRSEMPVTQTVVRSNAVDVPPVTTTTVVPTIETSKIYERPAIRPRRFRTLSTSTSSDITTTSGTTTVVTRPPVITQVPIHTTGVLPGHHVVHRPYRPPSTPPGYYSSDLDYGKRKVYKTDYKYRHYYLCNLCRGRCDLHNRSYGCCEWFYGCPLWVFIILGLIFLALLGGFFALFGLNPSINSARRAETAETHLINRTQIIYGFYQNCGYQVNSTNVPTTQILCTNTATTTTAIIQLSSFYTVISGTYFSSYNVLLILFCNLFILRNSGI